jgi:SAM-dependent methyltransferase
MPLDANSRDDEAFEAVFPHTIRRVSGRFWTPVAVARRAAELLRHGGATRILDVGSGAGKFVLAAAAAAPELEFVGVEHRKNLVAVARRARLRLGIGNAQFLLGDATLTPWSTFDGFYFFNPLAENLFPRDQRLDDRVELSEDRFVHDTLAIEAGLKVVRPGTLVVTYHGPSVRMPGSYGLQHSERAGSDWLRVWAKGRHADDGAFFVDVGDEVEHFPARPSGARARYSSEPARDREP